jgi:hypothetical protein
LSQSPVETVLENYTFLTRRIVVSGPNDYAGLSEANFTGFSNDAQFTPYAAQNSKDKREARPVSTPRPVTGAHAPPEKAAHAPGG